MCVFWTFVFLCLVIDARPLCVCTGRQRRRIQQQQQQQQQQQRFVVCPVFFFRAEADSISFIELFAGFDDRNDRRGGRGGGRGGRGGRDRQSTRESYAKLAAAPMVSLDQKPQIMYVVFCLLD